MNDLNFYDLRGTRINNYQSESLDSLKESSCINLCFSQGSYSYLPNIIIKAHIFFGTKKPELYFNPIGENYSMCLHSFCEICKFWLRQYIDGNRKMINKLSEILYDGEHPVLLKFIPYLKRSVIHIWKLLVLMERGNSVFLEKLCSLTLWVLWAQSGLLVLSVPGMIMPPLRFI